MAETSWPWDSGAGSAITDDQWRELAYAFGTRDPGIVLRQLNDLTLYADSTGMHVKLKTGYAAAFAQLYKNDAEKTITIASNATGSTRWDRIVVGFNWVSKTATAYVKLGTSDPNDSAPTQNLTTLWEVDCGLVGVLNGAVTIASTAVNIADRETVSNKAKKSKLYVSTANATDLGGTSGTWPAGNTYSVKIPKWARVARTRALINGVYAVTDDANHYVRTELGSLQGFNPRVRIAQGSGTTVYTIVREDEFDVTAIAGTTVTLRTFGARVSGTGALRVNNGEAQHSVFIEFAEE